MQASCQCGSLTAEIRDGAEPMVSMCHCLDCQRRSGSQFGSIAYYPAEAVTIAGEAREFARSTDSGNTFTTGFCPTCGSTVYARPERTPPMIGVTVGTFADPGFPRPVRSVYEQSKHHWIESSAEIQGFMRGRDGERTR
jgi:hypothetical protein